MVVFDHQVGWSQACRKTALLWLENRVEGRRSPAIFLRGPPASVTQKEALALAEGGGRN